MPLREVEFRLDDDLDKSLTLWNFGSVFEKTREKAGYGECCYMAMPIQLFSCHLESHALT